MLTIEDYEITIFPSPDKDERWLYVRFHEIPEILTGGRTIEEAIQNAKEAFNCHIEALHKQGKDIPLPSIKKVYAWKKVFTPLFVANDQWLKYRQPIMER